MKNNMTNSEHGEKSMATDESGAIAMLLSDHKTIRNLFIDFEELFGQDGADAKKAALAQKICFSLQIHARIEQEIFYPLVRAAIDDYELMTEASIEHAGVMDLIEQIEAMRPGDDLYDARVIVLGEQVERHVKEEEEMMFPLAMRAGVDGHSLGTLVHQRRIELMVEMGIEDKRRVPMSVSSRAANMLNTEL